MLKEHDGLFRKHLKKGPHQDKTIRAAIDTFDNQKRRCYIKSNPSYCNYGAKGIVVEYSIRQFIHWYLKEIKKFNGINPSVGRKDHSKNYSFDNIEIQSIRDNVIERNSRLGNPSPKKEIFIICAKTNEKIMVAESTTEAAVLTRNSRENIHRYCNGKYKSTRNGYTFRYAN